MKLEVNNSHKSALMGGLNKNKKRIVASILGAVIGMSFFSGATRVKAIDNEEDYEDDNEVVTTVDNLISEQSNEIYEVQDYNNNNISELSDEDVVEIGDRLKNFVSKAVGKDENDFITVGDLKGITDLELSYFTSYDDLSWLNYCINLKSLSFSFENLYAVEALKKIESLSNLEYLGIDGTLVANHLENIEFNEDNFGFLRNCPNLKSLCITSC